MTSRAYACLFAAWLVVSSVLASRHEAEVGHATDRAGHVVHAQVLVGHHDGPSDVHPRGSADHDECTILVALHQAARTPMAPALGVVLQVAPTIELTPPATHVAVALYRLAPKTSPPADRAS